MLAKKEVLQLKGAGKDDKDQKKKEGSKGES